MAVIETLALPVDLIGDCQDAGCVAHAQGLYETLSPIRYQRGVSIMACPDSLEEWCAEHRTARKRADRCKRLGYRFGEVDYSLYPDDLYTINTSLSERQGRPMTDGYLHRIERGRLPDYPCAAHRTITYGVLKEETLVAYTTIHRSCKLAMISMILGHGDHLRNDVMYLLANGVIGDQSGHGGVLFYNRHDSGTPGLVFFKERLGFYAGDVTWSM